MATAAALIALGLPLAAIWMAGLRRLVRDDDVHAFRPLGDAYPVLLALSLVLGSKLYYTSGLLLVQLAAGGVPVECWLARNRRGPALLAAVAGPVIVVGWDRREYLTGYFVDCAEPARIDNGVDLDNEEQGGPVWTCRAPAKPWRELWPDLRHLSP